MMAALRKNDADRQKVVTEVLEWINTPYHHHGRIKGAGVDCAMLLCEVFERAGVIGRVDPGFYAHDWHLHHGIELFSDWLGKHAREKNGPFQPGDIALWKYGRTFSHGSIYVGENLFAHSYIGRGVILSRADEEPLAGREMQHWSFW